MMERLLSLAKKRCEQAEVVRVWHRSTPANFEANRLKMLETKESSGIALRIVRNGRIGLSATNDPKDVDELVARAIELSEFGAVAKFELPGPAKFPDVPVFDRASEAVTVEQMADFGQAMIDILRRANSDLVCEAGVTKSIDEVEIINSNGCHASYKRSSFSYGVHGTLIRGTDMLFVGDWGASCSPMLDPKPVTKRPLEQLEFAKETVPAPQGEVPVIFTPHAIAYLLMPLTSAVNGRTVLQGASPLQGKLGTQLMDPRFSLWDDPTVPLRPDSRNADDEGVPSRKTLLIEKGVPQGFLYDLQTAGLAGAKSTGSASRSLSSLPTPSTSVLFIEKGDTPYERMVADVQDGLIIEQLLGAGQGNVAGGEIGGNVLLGYRVRNGKVVGRVKDTVIAGNVYTALSAGKLIALSDAQEWVSGSLLTPAIACMGITVSTKRAGE